MRDLRVGDIVVGSQGNGYGITGRGSVCKVIHMYRSQEIRVKVIEPRGNYVDTLDVLSKKRQIGKEFDVDSKYFVLKKDLMTENE